MAFTDNDSSREASPVAANGSPPRDNLFRSLPTDIGMRSNEGEDLPTLVGHFAVFDEWTEINSRYEGNFLERFAPGAFKKTISEGRDRIRVLFNHGRDPQIGNKVLGPITELVEDEKGAYYEATLLDTSYNRDLLPGLKAKLYGASFRFGVVIEDFVQHPKPSSHNPRGLSERTVREAFVREFGPVTFGQYEGATSGVRSLTDEFVIAAEKTPSGIIVPRAIPSNEETRSQRLYERSSAYVSETPWAIHPSALATIVGIVADRRAGVKLTAEEIKERIGTREQPPVAPEPGVAIITIAGPIVPHANLFSDVSGGASVDQILSELRAAVASEDVKSILLNIDSPGGSVSMVPEIGVEIMRAREIKPVVAVANTFAASAAYWIAASASEIVVSPSGQVGSIGVYSAHTDHSAQDEMLGEKTTLISAGKYKVEGNPYEPLSEEAAAAMQESVDAYYEMFVAAVAKGRGVKVSEVREGFGQGRMVMAKDAVAAGMADRVATFDETLARLLKQKPATDDATTALGPESSVATTPTTETPTSATQEPGIEPEPSEATTRSNHGLFRFVEPPKHMRSK